MFYMKQRKELPVTACNEERYESGRGQPHSKTCRSLITFRNARQRLGVRLSSAAFPRAGNFFNPALACVFAAVVLTPGLSLWAQSTATNAPAGDPVVAKGKGLQIKRSELDRAVARAEAQVASRGRTVKPEQRVEMERQLLEQLINNQLVLAKATAADKAAGKASAEQSWLEAKTKPGSEEAFLRQQKLMGVTRDEVIAQWTKAMTGEAVLKREFKIRVTDQDARKFYDENPTQFDVPETVRIRHILLLTCDPKTGVSLPADQQAAKRQRIRRAVETRPRWRRLRQAGRRILRRLSLPRPGRRISVPARQIRAGSRNRRLLLED